MVVERTFEKRDILIIAIVVALVLTVFALGYSQILHDDSDVPIIPVSPQNNTYEANVTFVLPSGNLIFHCELADTTEERQEGLMNRESLDNDTGMLFVFESSHEVSFWMKNTLIPLDIIFINATGYVVNIQEADPEPGIADDDLLRYPSNGPVLYALEINQGISAAEGIVPGTYVELQY